MSKKKKVSPIPKVLLFSAFMQGLKVPPSTTARREPGRVLVPLLHSFTLHCSPAYTALLSSLPPKPRPYSTRQFFHTILSTIILIVPKPTYTPSHCPLFEEVFWLYFKLYFNGTKFCPFYLQILSVKGLVHHQNILNLEHLGVLLNSATANDKEFG